MKPSLFDPLSAGFDQIAEDYYRRDTWEAELYNGLDGSPWILLREVERGIVYDGPNDARILVIILEELSK